MANWLDSRAQEALCRIHALTDEQHRDLWLSMAERWSYLAQEEARSLLGRNVEFRHKAMPEAAIKPDER
jgi:hypothetical protein